MINKNKTGTLSPQSTILNPQSSLGPVMLDVEGKELTQTECELLQHPNVGGVILFARNYESPIQIKHLIQEIRQQRSELLIAVDQEGGRVQRFREGFTRLPPLAEFGRLYQHDPEQAKKMAEDSAKLMANELLAVGVDFSFAPVLDLDLGISAVIGDRSFAKEAVIVAELAQAYIRGLNSVGMAAIGKHFPGHGAVVADSHLELPVDEREFSEIWQQDLLPYQKLKNLLAGIMTAHVIYPKVDKLPASFSSYWLNNVLRQQIGFTGTIFSDDLNMAGANYAGNYLERAQLALNAGCDMILVCNNRDAAISIIDHLPKVSSPLLQKRLQRMRAE